MTSQEFVLWLKGFSEGVHEYNITPKQWDILKDKLKEVEDKTLILESPKFPHITTPMVQPVYLPSNDPYERFKTYCGDTNGTTLATSSGSSGTITIANPYIVSFTTGSATYNPSATTYGYISGSAWSYTNTLPTNRWNEYQATMAGYRPYQPYTTGGEDEVIKHHNED
jgi:hypothetical protein